MIKSNKKLLNIKSIYRESLLPRLEIDVLLAYILNKGREYILAYPETLISSVLYKKFKFLEIKRLNNWPIAYLLGVKSFYGLDFKVNPSVLIPRPETELIIDRVLSIVKASKAKKICFIDLGTGSGVIPITIGTELNRLFSDKFINSLFYAVDISSSALNVAKQNSLIHGLASSIKFCKGNLLNPLNLKISKFVNHEIIITANLPYLTPMQIKRSPSITHEPRLALDGGKDGLKLYIELFKQLIALNLLSLKCSVICEISPTQSLLIKNIAKKYFPTSKLSINKDLAGKNRLFIISN